MAAWLTQPPTELLLTVALLLLGAERIGELLLNRRNARRLAARGAVWHGPDGFRLIVATQTLLFLLVPLEVALAPWSGAGWWTWPLLAIALAAQALRYWCIATLGERWNVRVVTLPGAAPVAGGPYRWLRHPNYLAVLAEMVVLPLAFGAFAAAALLVPLKLVALRRRIAVEDRALRDAAPPLPAEKAGTHRG